MAQARNNKVIGWSATDEKGNKVPVKTQTGGGTGGGTAGKITVTISYNEKYGTINNIVIIDSEKEPEL